MAYSAVAQGEHDVLSDSTDSPLASPQLLHNNMHFQSVSTDLVPQSPTSPMISRQGSITLRHPTPGLESLQGAYVGNIERLEQSAERLSMSSDIGEEIRKIKMELRRSASNRSSILEARSEASEFAPTSSRQISHGYGSHASDSIIGTNNIARSGGFSPAGYFASPRSSIRSETWSRSSAKGTSTSQLTRLTQLQEPEQEGKPLDSLLSGGFVMIPPPPESSSKVLRVMNNEEDANGIEIPRPLNISPHKQQDSTDGSNDRPTTAASTGTSNQADGFFHDFDGIHATPQPQDLPAADDVLDHNEEPKPDVIFERPKSLMQPPSENMVYYPAPVPMMLNLPQRLSKLPSAPQREKRQSTILGGLPSNARKSASWLPHMIEGENEDARYREDDPSTQPPDQRNSRSVADLPPQLRASVFFDYPSTRQDVEVKEESAVATLDSILDASAFAPVTAFTDHPHAGRMGAEVYGRTGSKSQLNDILPLQTGNRKRRVSVNLLKKRYSASALLEDTRRRSGSFLGFEKRRSGGRVVSDPTADEAAAASLHSEETPLRVFDHEDPRQADGISDDDVADYNDAQQIDAGSENGDNTEFDQYEGQPTTLLAELQLRKQQQKQRNRTAATAFPEGMHSTLLELDTVAKVQQQSRKQKQVKLAWEDPNAQHPGIENEDDEDVPLAMLFPNHKANVNHNGRRFNTQQPLGLIARREMEDNEPLSHRRARLRGEDLHPRNQSPNRRATMYTLEIPDFTEDDAEPPFEIEDETLAQRAKRLRMQNANSQQKRMSSDFASEVMSQFGGLPTDTEKQPSNEPIISKTPDPEETLGQRRKRLQAERETTSRNASGENGNTSPEKPPISKRRSMADILQAHPAAGARNSSYGQQTSWALKQQQAAPNLLAMASDLGLLGAPHRGSIPVPRPGLNNYPNPMVYNHPISRAAGVPYGSSPGLHSRQAHLELDPRSHDMIDRWRQSVTH